MNVLWVLAHPEERSLNAALHRDGVAALVEAGHQVEVSDLYAMKWNPVVDRDDYCAGMRMGFRIPHILAGICVTATAAWPANGRWPWSPSAEVPRVTGRAGSTAT
jgi:putative NADPH-quinone reductase